MPRSGRCAAIERPSPPRCGRPGRNTGPRRARRSTRRCRLEALARLLGPLTLGAVTFDDDAAPLEWRVELRGAGVTYHLTAEPFAGRVTSLVRTGAAQ